MRPARFCAFKPPAFCRKSPQQPFAEDSFPPQESVIHHGVNVSPVCRLVELPAELRNHIHRYTLLAHHNVRIARTEFPEPGILRACHFVRREAEPIFLSENMFDVVMTDYDSIALVPIAKRVSRVNQQYRAIPDIGFALVGAPDWGNVLDWMEKVHQIQAAFALPLNYGAEDTGLLGVERQLLTTICMYAYTNSDMEWKKVEMMIERLHVTLKTANPLWN